MDLDRPMPHSIDAEAALLGSMILGPEAIDVALAMHVESGHFHQERNQTVFRACVTSYSAREATDIVLVEDELARAGALDDVGGFDYLRDLVEAVPSTANACWYAEIVLEKAGRRAAINAAHAVSARAMSDTEDLADIIGDACDTFVALDAGGLARSEPMDIGALLAFDAANDPNALLGERWVTRGDLAMLVAQAGIGKSSLILQGAVSMAVGRQWVGIPFHGGPVRSLMVQAENNFGDMGEALQGVVANLGLTTDPAIITMVADNLTIERNQADTGSAFLRYLRLTAARCEPDIIWIDPLLAFLGGDASDQVAVGAFLRNGLAPIASALNAAVIIVHHVPKPTKDNQSWSGAALAYSSHGSAELTNAPRAGMFLRECPDSEGTYELVFTKRRDRVGRPQPVYLAHGDSSIFWKNANPPPGAAKPVGRPRKADPEAVRLAAHAMGYGEIEVSNGECYKELADQFKSSVATIRRILE